MPISEDEYENRPNQSSMSKAEQRRNNKPIMEKRRRARINHCLNELKTLILDAMKKDPARHSKLEKADILEMTVKHLQGLQRQQLAVAVATDPTVLHKFKTGFNECAGEVSRYIGNMDGVETGVKQRLVAHLNNCVSGLQQPAPFSFSNIGGSSNPINIPQGNLPSPEDVNNNQNATRIQVPPGIQLIPSRLPTGELALLVPNGSNLPFFNSSVLGGAFNDNTPRSSNSAFTTVKPTKHSENLKMSSPPLSPASSTTSFDDHVSDSFLKPRTPSPKEVTISFPTPPGSSMHAFKPVTNIQEVSPAQQFHVSSTSYSPESTKSDYGLKIEYKTVPIYQPHGKPNKSMEPLSVITSDKPKIQECEERSRKRPYPENSNSLLVLVNQDPQPSTSKYARYSLDDVSTTSSGGNPDERFSVERHFHHPSASGHADNQQNNDHMWRPW